jgi:hypothetical protein
MPSPIIKRLYDENKLLITKLLADGEISLVTTIDDILRKTLLMSAASYFEHTICEAILEYVSEIADNDAAVISLVKAKAIERQYHTYFDWNASNANSFFSYFGEKYKLYAKEIVEKDPDLRESIRAFLELGSLRNQLVHQNYAIFPLEKTADEIYRLYIAAFRFVDFFPESLRNFPRK